VLNTILVAKVYVSVNKWENNHAVRIIAILLFYFANKK